MESSIKSKNSFPKTKTPGEKIKTMSESKKFFINSALALSTMIATALFYHSTFVLIPLLSIIGALMLFLEFEKSDFFFYVMIFTLGPLAESLVISFGGWSYAKP